jgi:hypothetical protein
MMHTVHGVPMHTYPRGEKTSYPSMRGQNLKFQWFSVEVFNILWPTICGMHRII